MAFLNGVLWNAFNFAIVAWLFWRRQRRAPAGQWQTAQQSNPDTGAAEAAPLRRTGGPRPGEICVPG
jgi:hypothetical protein